LEYRNRVGAVTVMATVARERVREPTLNLNLALISSLPIASRIIQTVLRREKRMKRPLFSAVNGDAEAETRESERERKRES
jgi:hypothetical protein